MNLKELLTKTGAKNIFLIDEKGQIIDFFPKEEELNELQQKMIAFKATIFNMSNHFFNDFLNSNLTEIILKSNQENMLLIKHNEYMLCFLSEKNINIGLLELILKKEINSNP